MKLPSLQLYPGDWKKDPGIQALSFEERGVWMELLFLMHESEQRGKLLLNGHPIPEDRLAKIIGIDPILLNQILTTLDNLGVSSVCEDTGALMSRRMVRDEAIMETRRNAGKLGGNPLLLNQKPTTGVKQKPTPSSSSSSSIKEERRSEPEFPDDLPEPMRAPLRLWWQHKREKGKAYKSIGWTTLINQQRRKTTEQLTADVESSIAGNYDGIFPAKNQFTNANHPANTIGSANKPGRYG